jgi:hypothetical protein
VKPQLTIRHRCDSRLVRAMALKSRASDRTRFSRIHGVPAGAPQLFRELPPLLLRVGKPSSWQESRLGVSKGDEGSPMDDSGLSPD